MQTVIVKLAFSFTCPSCEKEIYIPSTIKEFNQEEQFEAAEEFGFKPQTGDYVTHPETVTCPECLEEYEAKNEGEE